MASADATYAAIAAFGLTLLTHLLIDMAVTVRLIGGLFLLYLGIKTLLSRPVTADPAHMDMPARSAGRDFASAYALTITNPQTILMFAGIFAGAGLATTSAICAAVTVGGIFAGSAGWWLMLTTGVGLLRARLTPLVMLWINRASGAVIIVFALVTLAALVQ